MADLTPIAGVSITGVPIFGDPFAQDLSPNFVGGGLSLNEAAAAQEALYPGAPDEAFAPPVPVLLPEVIVTPPPVTAPPVAVPVVRTIGGALTGIGAGLLALLFPTPTAPAYLDEAPIPPQKPPPPPIEPTLDEPQLPPNWADMARGGDESLLEPIRAPGLPVPLPDWREDPFWIPVELEPVTLTPPPVTTRGNPWLGVFADPFSTVPGGTPYDVPVTPDFGPGPAPAPTSPPGVDPVPGFPDLFPFVQPGDRTAPAPASPTAPDLFGSPLPDIFGDPIGDPFPAPEQPAGPSPTPGTPTQPGIPDLFADPSVPRLVDDPLGDPFLTQFQPEPLRPNADACQCDKPKKKPKKKSKPRDVCYRGTYVQRSRGISYSPKEEVPCEAKKRVSNRETDAFGRPVPRKRKSGRTPTWQDTINDVFYPKP